MDGNMHLYVFLTVFSGGQEGLHSGSQLRLLWSPRAYKYVSSCLQTRNGTRRQQAPVSHVHLTKPFGLSSYSYSLINTFDSHSCLGVKIRVESIRTWASMWLCGVSRVQVTR